MDTTAEVYRRDLDIETDRAVWQVSGATRAYRVRC